VQMIRLATSADYGMVASAHFVSRNGWVVQPPSQEQRELNAVDPPFAYPT